MLLIDAQTVSSVKSRSSESKRSSASYSSYSSSASSSTITTRTPSPTSHKSKKKTATIETQTDGATKPWIPGVSLNFCFLGQVSEVAFFIHLGMSYVDSAYFKPTRLVQGEILEVLSAQNPAAIALQDLLKQQLALTRYALIRTICTHRILEKHKCWPYANDMAAGWSDGVDSMRDS